ncbi:TB2/DP1, HVA22 family-domain-containing protein [Mycena floridula]|nr:TB2/DP1, HVA22 family-domain-containing protein [Mycena floridula]
MLFYLTSRVIGSITAFLYPGYASYKTLSLRPSPQAELERWLMYWSVLGCVVGVEILAEWAISWIPFYYTIKTLFLLYLSLPQTQGSSYIYHYHLQPFFQSHELQIDAALASFKAKVYSFLQDRVRLLWDHISATAGQQQDVRNMPAAAPPLVQGWSPAQLASSLWRSYGPAIIASGNAMLNQNAASGSSTSSGTTQSLLERRRQLESELAALSQFSGDNRDIPVSMPVPMHMPAAGPLVSTSLESDVRHRDRTISVASRFEKIEIPEGYDVGDTDEGEGHSYQSQPTMQKRGSWFGWGSGSPSSSNSKGGYERVKSD